MVVTQSQLWTLLFSVNATIAFQSRPRPWISHSSASTTTRRMLEPNGNDNNNNNNNNGFDATGFPTNPGKSRPSKADLYSNEELETLLNLHQSLNENGGFDNEAGEPQDPATTASSKNEGPVPFGLHDMVLQVLEEMDAEPKNDETPSPQPQSQSSNYTTTTLVSLSDETKQTLLGIRAIASDVDGTLVSSDQTVHAQTKQAIQRAVEAAFSPVRSLRYFFPATGKTRPGALRSLGSELSALLSQCPGVFVQGLYCVDGNGKVVFEQKLEPEQADSAIQFAESHGLSVFGYDGDKIYTTSQSNPRHVAEFHNVWGEPTPIILDSLLGYENRFHKCLLWNDDVEANANLIRPQLEELAASKGGCVTVAIPTMLEFLPQGASKALGVQKLCEHLGIDMSSELLAIGDAENDIGMLQKSAFGIAVGNAGSKVKDIADLVMNETNNEGGAGLAIELFGLGDALNGSS